MEGTGGIFGSEQGVHLDQTGPDADIVGILVCRDLAFENVDEKVFDMACCRFCGHRVRFA